ncbi:MAG TPA: hypothetical protein VKV27_10495 [Solirubrobacteraceae bacterium]|nr:hypothetical protein [Solirubrobacteraceae bacterium]
MVILCALACALGLRAAPAAADRPRTPTPAPSDTQIAGPSTSIVSLDGMSVARDGTGGLVFLQDVGGVAHVFVSVLSGGTFQAPVQVDAGLPGPSSSPVIAAGDGGVLLVAFVNGGTLYTSQTLAAGQPFSAPAALYSPAASPAISMSNFGKAYLAFTDPAQGEVLSAFWWGAAHPWTVDQTPLNAAPQPGAGLGAGRPAVVTAGDGVGIVAWGQGGHIYTRRVVGTTPSVVFEQADPSSYDGWQEVSAADPVISAGGDDTYATVAFSETLSNGASQQTLVLDNRLYGSQYAGATQADGATLGGAASATDPQAAVNEYGRGFVTSSLTPGNQLFAAPVYTDDVLGGPQQVGSLPDDGPPYAVPAIAGLISTLIAWQQAPGVAGPAEIRVRYAPDGYDLGPELVVSSPALGPADAAAGLFAGGDAAGDAAIAWVQGAPGQQAIVAAQLYQAPGAPAPERRFQYSRTATPLLAWSPASELWGPTTYQLTIDGATQGQTTGLSLAPSQPLTDGRHVFQVTAVNRAGVATPSRPAVVFVDTVAPRATMALRGARVRGRPLRIIVRYADLPPAGLPPYDASGVATVYVRWGDGTVQRIRRNAAVHVYRRARRYTITVVVTDRAGNRTVLRRQIRITAHPARRHRHASAHRSAPRRARRFGARRAAGRSAPRGGRRGGSRRAADRARA